MRPKVSRLLLGGLVALLACTGDEPDEGADGAQRDESDAATETVAREPVVELDRAVVVPGDGDTERTLTTVTPLSDGGWLGWATTRAGADVGHEILRSGGGEWEAIEVEGLPDNPVSVRHLRQGPDGRLFAFGRGPDGESGWHSDDGLQWEPLGVGGLGGLEEVTVGAVTVSDDGFVAIAEDVDFDGDSTDPVVGLALLTSPDGHSWELVADQTDTPVRGTPTSMALTEEQALVITSRFVEDRLEVALEHLDADGVTELGIVEDLLEEGARVEDALHDGSRWLLGGSVEEGAAIWSADEPAGPWSRVEVEGTVFDGQGRQSISVLGQDAEGRLLAAGTTAIGGDSQQRLGHAELWWEDAAGDWQRSEAPAVLRGEDVAPQLSGMVLADDGAVLLHGSLPVELDDGQREALDEGRAASPGSSAAAWVAERGEREVMSSPVEVTTISDGELGGDGDQHLSDVVRSEEGLVAVGWDQPDLDGPQRAAVWRSGDGTSWQRVPTSDELEGDGENDRRMRAVTVADDGALVAVGFDRGQQGAVSSWRSEDGGDTWEVATADDGDGTVSVSDVTQTSHGLIAVGNRRVEETFTPWAWRSEDGLSWEEIELPGPTAAEHVHLPGRVAEVEGRLLVAGTTGTDIEWWDGGYSYGVRTMLLVGEDPEALEVVEEAFDPESSGWMQGMLSDDGRPLVAGSRTFDDDGWHRAVPRLWSISEDGLEETELEDAGDSVRLTEAVDAGTMRVLAGETSVGGTSSLALVADVDGGWSRVPHDRETFEGGVPLEVHAGTALDGIVVLVGAAGERADGRDGVVWLVEEAG
jgi:hypothetical protein